MKKMRLQKYLAQRGVASRRKCEEFIGRGLVRVNGEVVREMGVKVEEGVDRVEVLEEAVGEVRNFRTYMLNKPRGVLSTAREGGREGRSVVDLLRAGGVVGRLFPIGRLDKDSSGLILVTDDGSLTYGLTHPSEGKEKEYYVRAGGEIVDGEIENLRRPIMVRGRMTRAANVERVAWDQVRIVLGEGRNRQIRRLFEREGLRVRFLHRVRIRGLCLDRGLGEGCFRLLTVQEVEGLRV